MRTKAIVLSTVEEQRAHGDDVIWDPERVLLPDEAVPVFWESYLARMEMGRARVRVEGGRLVADIDLSAAIPEDPKQLGFSVIVEQRGGRRLACCGVMARRDG